MIPTELLTVFIEHTRFSYYYSYFSASLISQATLEIYIRSNILKKHVQSIKKELGERIICLEQHFRKLATYDITCLGGKTGYYSYLKLPHNMNENELIENLKKRQVFVAGGSNYSFYLDDAWRGDGIRLSIARTNKRSIDKGFEIIYEELAKR